MLVAHHDAGHGGAVFDHSLADTIEERWPGLIGRFNTYPPIMWPTVAGPILTALGALTGSRRLLGAGAAFGLGTAAAMADIARSPVSPGASDNLSAVAVLLGVAEALQDQPVEGLRVLLVSTGSEESFMEGMRRFMERWAPDLPKDRTTVVCLETLGCPRLALIEGEGMAWMTDYPQDTRDLVADVADEAGIDARPRAAHARGDRRPDRAARGLSERAAGVRGPAQHPLALALPVRRRRQRRLRHDPPGDRALRGARAPALTPARTRVTSRPARRTPPARAPRAPAPSPRARGSFANGVTVSVATPRRFSIRQVPAAKPS